MAEPVSITDENFDEEVLNADTPVLVDFWAEWCGPCKAIGPVMRDLANEYDGRVKVGKIDTDSNREVSVRFSISAIPTVILFSNGELVEKFIGLRGKREFKDSIDKSLVAG